MSRNHARRGRAAGMFVGVTLTLSLGASICAAQTQHSKSAAVKPPAPAKSEVEVLPASKNKKPAFADWMRVSTEAEGRRAADEASTKKMGKKLESNAPKSDPVMEFQTVSPASEPVFVEKKKEKGGALKNIHGEVYGMSGGLGTAEGGDVGATAKGGKLDIFLGAGHAKSDASAHR